MFVSVGARYLFTEDREDVRVRGDFLRATAVVATLRCASIPTAPGPPPERPDAFFPCFGTLMILRTAATRSELISRISPISSGVGTGLPMTWALTHLLYDSFWVGGAVDVEARIASGSCIKGAPDQRRGTLSDPASLYQPSHSPVGAKGIYQQ